MLAGCMADRRLDIGRQINGRGRSSDLNPLRLIIQLMPPKEWVAKLAASFDSRRFQAANYLSKYANFALCPLRFLLWYSVVYLSTSDDAEVGK